MKNRFRKLIICLSLVAVLVCSLSVPSFAASGPYLGFSYGADAAFSSNLEFTLNGVNVFDTNKTIYFRPLTSVDFIIYVFENDPISAVVEDDNLKLTFSEPYVLYVGRSADNSGEMELISNDDNSTSYSVTIPSRLLANRFSIYKPSREVIDSGVIYYPITPIYEAYNPVNDASSLVTNAVNWVSSMAGLVMNNPLILAYALLPILGVGIGLLVRAKNSNK